ncbi:MAG: hypothetical protein C4291_15690 [Candidatus Dadabacteria bacterium]
MKPFYFFLLLTVGAPVCNAGNVDVISRPGAGQGYVAIAKGKRDGTDYFFLDTNTNEWLGDVLGDLRGARINA